MTNRPASLRAQDLEPALVINGSLYLVRTDVLRTERTFLPSSAAGVVMNAPLHNLDIDTEFDWLVAEQAIRYFQEKQ
jgi:CMP-N-acetylneuraminic acid synthetase